MARLDVTSFMVRGEDGNYDLDSSIAKFTDEATTYVALHSADQEKITEAMLGVFAPNPKLTLNVPALCTLVLDKVWDRNPAAYCPLAQRIHEVLSGSADSNGVKSPGIREIIVERGPGKGARLRTEGELAFFDSNGRDMTKEEKEAAVEEARKAAARK